MRFVKLHDGRASLSSVATRWARFVSSDTAMMSAQARDNQAKRRLQTKRQFVRAGAHSLCRMDRDKKRLGGCGWGEVEVGAMLQAHLSRLYVVGFGVQGWGLGFSTCHVPAWQGLGFRV